MPETSGEWPQAYDITVGCQLAENLDIFYSLALHKWTVRKVAWQFPYFFFSSPLGIFLACTFIQEGVLTLNQQFLWEQPVQSVSEGCIQFRG